MGGKRYQDYSRAELLAIVQDKKRCERQRFRIAKFLGISVKSLKPKSTPTPVKPRKRDPYEYSTGKWV